MLLHIISDTTLHTVLQMGRHFASSVHPTVAIAALMKGEAKAGWELVSASEKVEEIIGWANLVCHLLSLPDSPLSMAMAVKMSLNNLDVLVNVEPRVLEEGLSRYGESLEDDMKQAIRAMLEAAFPAHDSASQTPLVLESVMSQLGDDEDGRQKQKQVADTLAEFLPPEHRLQALVRLLKGERE